jgi:hypothetical protein
LAKHELDLLDSEAREKELARAMKESQHEISLLRSALLQAQCDLSQAKTDADELAESNRQSIDAAFKESKSTLEELVQLVRQKEQLVCQKEQEVVQLKRTLDDAEHATARAAESEGRLRSEMSRTAKHLERSQAEIEAMKEECNSIQMLKDLEVTQLKCELQRTRDQLDVHMGDVAQQDLGTQVSPGLQNPVFGCKQHEDPIDQLHAQLEWEKRAATQTEEALLAQIEELRSELVDTTDALKQMQLDWELSRTHDMSLLASTHEKGSSMRHEQAKQIRTLSAQVDTLEAQLAERDLKLQRVQQKLSRAQDESALHREQIERLGKQRDDLAQQVATLQRDTGLPCTSPSEHQSTQQQIFADVCAIRDEFGFGIQAERIEQLELELEQALTCAVMRVCSLDPVVTPDHRLLKSAPVPSGSDVQSYRSNERDEPCARQHGKKQGRSKSAGAPSRAMPAVPPILAPCLRCVRPWLSIFIWCVPCRTSQRRARAGERRERSVFRRSAIREGEARGRTSARCTRWSNHADSAEERERRPPPSRPVGSRGCAGGGRKLAHGRR